jgi:hypothetical protein
LSFCLAGQAFTVAFNALSNRIYVSTFYKLVFFYIKQVFTLFFFLFLKKRAFFSKYFVLTFVHQTFYAKTRVLRVFFSTLLNFWAGTAPSYILYLFRFLQVSLVIFFCYLVWDFLLYVFLLSITLVFCMNFSNVLRIENVDFFALFRRNSLFADISLPRLFYSTTILFTIAFDMLWVLLILYYLICAVLPRMQTYLQEALWYLNLSRKFWLSNIFFIVFKKRYTKLYYSTVKASALVCSQLFDLFRINLRLSEYWYFYSLISCREFTWLLLGFVQIFWAQLAWWRNPTQNVKLWRQIFSVNKVLLGAGFIQRGPVLNNKLIYISVFDHLVTFLTSQRLWFLSSQLVSNFTKNFIQYFSFLISTKINLLQLNWYTNLRLLRARRSEAHMQIKISIKYSWKFVRLLQAAVAWVCTSMWNVFGFVFYQLRRAVFLFFLLIQVSASISFLVLLTANTSFLLLFYLSAKLFLLTLVFYKLRS